MTNLIKQLKDKEVFTQEIRVVDSGGIRRRKQLRFIKSHDDSSILIVTRTDVEDIIKGETEKQKFCSERWMKSNMLTKPRTDS